MKLSRRQMFKLTAGAGAALALSRGSVFAGSLPRWILQDALNTRPIPSSGERLPVVGIGTRTYNTSAELRPILKEILTEMPGLGGTVIDTATGYQRGASETIIGELMAEIGIRNEYFIATKVAAEGTDAGVRQIEQSFDKLRTDVIDLMQVHNMRDTSTQLETIRRMKGEGRIRYAGVTTSSNRQHADFAAMMREQDLDFVQLNYSIGSRGAEEVLLPLARERGMAVMVNLPYGRGRTFRRVGERPLPDWARSFAESWGQFFLKFVVSHPAVTVAIPGTTQLRHLVDNMAANYGPLPDAATRERMVELFDALPQPEGG